MINHLTLLVNDLRASKEFYKKILQPLGYLLLKDEDHVAGFGIEDIDGKCDFWIKERQDKEELKHSLLHVAF